MYLEKIYIINIIPNSFYKSYTHSVFSFYNIYSKVLSYYSDLVNNNYSIILKFVAPFSVYYKQLLINYITSFKSLLKILP